MIQSPDSEFENENDSQEEVIELQENIIEALPENKSLVVFQGKDIRRVWHNNEWWFSIFDIIAVLTNSSDPKQYIKKIYSVKT